jgi:hypothetical protein
MVFKILNVFIFYLYFKHFFQFNSLFSITFCIKYNTNIKNKLLIDCVFKIGQALEHFYNALLQCDYARAHAFRALPRWKYNLLRLWNVLTNEKWEDSNDEWWMSLDRTQYLFTTRKWTRFLVLVLKFAAKCGCKRVRSVAKGSQVNYFVPESILSVNQVFSDSVISIKWVKSSWASSNRQHHFWAKNQSWSSSAHRFQLSETIFLGSGWTFPNFPTSCDRLVFNL